MLSTVEEFLLLALDGKTGDFRRIHSEYFSAGLVGGAVMELALAGRIDSDVDRAWVVDASPTGEASLDVVLAEMSQPNFPPQIERVIGALVPFGKQIEEQVLTKLCETGVLERSEGRSLLLKKTTRYTIKDDREFVASKTRLQEMLLGEGLPEPRDVCLITLVTACGLLEQILPVDQHEAAMNRISKFSALDLIGQNVRRYLYLFERDLS